MKKKHYKVNGLANEEMKTQLKNALDKIEGVSNVCVDLAHGTVEVSYNPPTTNNEIESCIENTGHKIE